MLKASKVVKQLLDVREAPDNIKKCQERISSLKHKISVYTEKGIDEKLKKQTDMEEDRKPRRKGLPRSCFCAGIGIRVVLPEFSLWTYQRI